MDLLLSPQSLARPGLFVLVLTIGHLGLLVSSHSFARLELSLLTVGRSSLGLVFVLFVIDGCELDPSLSIRGFTRMGLALLVLDFLHLDSLSSTRSSARSESAVSFMGIGRKLDLPLPTVDLADFDLPLSLRAFSHLSFPIFALDYVKLGFSLSLHGLARGDSVSLASGLMWSGSLFSLSVVDTTRTESFPSLQSFSHIDSAFPVYDFHMVDSSTSSHDIAWFGFLLPISGLSCSGFVFFLSLIDCGHLGFPLPVRSFIQPESLLLALDHTGFEPFLSPQSIAHLDSLLLVLALAKAGSPFLPLDCAVLGSTISLRSIACFDLLIPLLEASTLGLLMFLHSYSHMGFRLPATGLTRTGSVFALSVMGPMHVEPLSFIRSLARPDSYMLVLEFTKSDFLVSLRDVTHSSSPLSCFGLTRVGFVFALSVTDVAHMDLPSLAQSLSHIAFLTLACDFSSVGLALFSKNLGRLSSAIFVMGMTCIGSSLLILCGMQVGPPVFVQSFAHSALAILACGFEHFDFFPLPRNLARSESTLLVSGLTCVGFASSLSLVDSYTMDLSMSLRGLGRFELLLSPLDFLHLGSSPFLRQVV